MSMDLEFFSKDGHLHVRVLGEFTLEDANDALLNMLDEVKSRQATRVLVDCLELEGGISIVERFMHSDFGSEALEKKMGEGLPPSVRFAYVMKGAFWENNEFSERVAVNRGVNVKNFDDERDARQWLALEDPLEKDYLQARALRDLHRNRDA